MTDARLRDSDAAVGKGAHHFDPGRDSACPPHLQSAREEFIERGFVAIPGLVNQSELTHFDEEITQAVASRKAGYPTKTEDISLYEQQFLQVRTSGNGLRGVDGWAPLYSIFPPRPLVRSTVVQRHPSHPSPQPRPCPPASLNPATVSAYGKTSRPSPH